MIVFSVYIRFEQLFRALQMQNKFCLCSRLSKSFLISHVPPAHSFFPKIYILENIAKSLLLIIYAYFNRLLNNAVRSEMGTLFRNNCVRK